MVRAFHSVSKMDTSTGSRPWDQGWLPVVVPASVWRPTYSGSRVPTTNHRWGLCWFPGLYFYFYVFAYDVGQFRTMFTYDPTRPATILIVLRTKQKNNSESTYVDCTGDRHAVHKRRRIAVRFDQARKMT